MCKVQQSPKIKSLLQDYFILNSAQTQRETTKIHKYNKEIDLSGLVSYIKLLTTNNQYLVNFHICVRFLKLHPIHPKFITLNKKEIQL